MQAPGEYEEDFDVGFGEDEENDDADEYGLPKPKTPAERISTVLVRAATARNGAASEKILAEALSEDARREANFTAEQWARVLDAERANGGKRWRLEGTVELLVREHVEYAKDLRPVARSEAQRTLDCLVDDAGASGAPSPYATAFHFANHLLRNVRENEPLANTHTHKRAFYQSDSYV